MADGDPSTLSWRGNLDISKANSLYAELESALDAGGPIELDAERVERVDTSIVQLLCIFWAEARARSIEVKWKAVSESLTRIARVLDLGSALDLCDASREKS